MFATVSPTSPFEKKITTFTTEAPLVAYLEAPQSADTEDTLTTNRIEDEALHVRKIHVFGQEDHAGQRNALVVKL